MKILLLFPKWTGEYGILAHFAKRASTWPPLNLAYLAAVGGLLTLMRLVRSFKRVISNKDGLFRFKD